MVDVFMDFIDADPDAVIDQLQLESMAEVSK